MITGESWKEQCSFSGHGSAVVMVIGTQECATEKTYEFRIECIGLDSYSKPATIVAYIWDKRDTDTARQHFQTLFKKGTFWRFSGSIEYDDGTIVFVDPVHMPFYGEACEYLASAQQ